MYQNEGGRIEFFVRTAAGAPVTGDAANITATVSRDGGAADPTYMLNPIEIGATGNYYLVLEPFEVAADAVIVQPTSSTPTSLIDPIFIEPFPARRAGRSEQRQVGKWSIESISLSDLKAQLSLREAKKSAEIKLPRNEFDDTTYPNIDPDIVGESIPIGFGQIFGARAFLIDSTTNRFKWLGHAVTTADGFYNGDLVDFTPNTINLTLGEFTYTAWNGTDDLFVDYTADLTIGPDVAKELLTGSVRGAGLDESQLDITSTGKGFGPSGARTYCRLGTIPNTGEEVAKYPIGLHISEPTEVRKLLAKIAEATFSFIYLDFEGVWQYKPWKPIPAGDLSAITENNIDGELKPSFSTAEAATKIVAKYRQNIGLDFWQRQVFANDELRQLRGLSAHTVLEKELIISDRKAAQNWAQRSVTMRGQVRRRYSFRGTSELKLAEPGEYYRLTYDPQGIDVVLLITSANQVPGETTVNIVGIDNYGFGDRMGFWTDDAPLTFPASLGGGTFDDWDDADTAAKKQYVKDNWSTWLNDNGYADEADPQDSYRINVWI